MAKTQRPRPLTGIDRLTHDFEIFVNQQAAEIEALRAILQSVLLRSEDQHIVEDLRRTTVGVLRQRAAEALDQDARRKAEFVVARAEAFFAEMMPIYA